MNTSTPIVAEGLSKRLGAIPAVDGLNLEVAAGEVFGFLGPNGAGKTTTTMRLLLGYLRPSAGRAEVLGGSPRDTPELWRRVGYLPGDLAVDPKLTGAEVLAWLSRLRGGVDPRRVEELAARLDFDPSRAFRTLSKGNRQKLGIVAAFMHDPDVLVLDEPTSGLDPLVQQEFLDLGTAGGGGIGRPAAPRRHPGP